MKLILRLTPLLLLCHGALAQGQRDPRDRIPVRPDNRIQIQIQPQFDREASPTTPNDNKPKPNIIFILCDDLGYGDVGIFHQNARKDLKKPHLQTPKIDALGQQGITLKQHYCAAPVCAPSRASLLTGLTQGHAPIRDNQFDKALPDTLNLASMLHEAGYSTAAIGKWGLQGKPETEDQPDAKDVPFPGWPAMPTNRGFDYFLGYVRHKDGHYHYPFEDRKQIWENHTEISNSMKLCFSADLFTAAAKKWIIETNIRNPDEPFFLYLAYDTPHAKLQNPPCAYPNGGGLEGGVQWIGIENNFLNTATGTYDGWMHPDYANATWDHDQDPATEEQAWPDVQKRYANNVRRIDDAVGDLMKLLDDLKISENTLVVFSSDNGPSAESYIKNDPYHPTFFEGYGPFEGIKRDTLEGGMRVPTIARWPGRINTQTEHNQPSGHWDWLATFAEAAGLPVPAASDGKSLLGEFGFAQRIVIRPQAQGNEVQAPIIHRVSSGNRTLYTEYCSDNKTPDYPEFNEAHRNKPRGQMQVVFVNNLKGIRTNIQNADQDFEIYDLMNDPKELNNLAKDGGLPDIQFQMKSRALQQRMPLDDAKRPYDDAPIPGIDNPMNRNYPGVSLRGYQGVWPWMPDFGTIRSGQFGGSFSNFKAALDFINLTEGNQIERRKPPIGIQIRTTIKIPADGRYTFTTKGNGQTMLFVHKIRLINELKHEGVHSQSGTLNLKAGDHPISFLYRTTQPNPDFNLELSGPDGKNIPLTEENLRISFGFAR